MLVLRSQVILLAIKYIFHSDICKNQAMEVNARNEKKLCQYRCMNRSAAELKALRPKKKTNKQTNK